MAELAPALSDAGTPPTLRAYVDEWLDLQQTQLQPSTWDSYRAVLSRYLLSHLGDTTLVDLDGRTFTRLYQHLLRAGGRDGRPLSIRTVRYVHQILHKALSDAVRDGLLRTNPSDAATLPKLHPDRVDELGDDQRVDAWSAAQLRAFLAATAGHPRHPLWVTAAGTGLRRGELLGLSWPSVDLDARTLVVRQSLSVVRRHVRLKPPKTVQSRTITFDGRVAAALAAQRAAQRGDADRLGPCHHNAWDLVFAAETGVALTPDVVSRWFRQAVAASGVAPLRLHGLRHTHATLLLQAGVPVKVVSQRLGHASVQLTLDVYAHVLPAMDADAAGRFADFVWDGD